MRGMSDGILFVASSYKGHSTVNSLNIFEIVTLSRFSGSRFLEVYCCPCRCAVVKVLSMMGAEFS